MLLRKFVKEDLSALLELYTQLNSSNVLEIGENTREICDFICNDEMQHIYVIEEGNRIVSTCTLTIIQNLTHRQRPYGIIENVVTDKQYRKKGYAEKLLNKAKEIAKANYCHKIVLLTSNDYEYFWNYIFGFKWW